MKKVLVRTYLLISILKSRLTFESRAVIGTTGGWRDSYRMAEAVERGDIDMCGLGRPLREDPHFVHKAMRGETRVSSNL